MNLLTLVSLGIALLLVAAWAAWHYLRAAAATDLGSISRNWMSEHRNDRE